MIIENNKRHQPRAVVVLRGPSDSRQTSTLASRVVVPGGWNCAALPGVHEEPGEAQERYRSVDLSIVRCQGPGYTELKIANMRQGGCAGGNWDLKVWRQQGGAGKTTTNTIVIVMALLGSH